MFSLKLFKQLLLPKTINDIFYGSKIVVYSFYLITSITLWRSLHHLFANDGGAQSIATIPLDTYSSGATDTIIGLFALLGLSQLLIGIIYFIVAVRYKSLIPLMYLLFIFEYLSRYLIGVFKSVETVGTAPGAIVNIPFVLLGIVLFIFSFVTSKSSMNIYHENKKV